MAALFNFRESSMKKRFRVATSGPTIDGREIKPEWLKQAAANYDPANIYAARVNVEHLRSLSPNGDFGAYGDVTALSAETDKNGKTALYAEIEPNAKAIAANKAGQKVFASIEIIENFAGTGEAYLVGLALTDSPASLGTERIHFTSQPADAVCTGQPFTAIGQKAHAFSFGYANPIEINFNEDKPETGFKDMFADLLENMKKAFAPQPAKPDANFMQGMADTLNTFAQTTAQKLQEMQTAFNAQLQEQKTAHDALAAQFAQLKTQLESQPAAQFTRPLSTGGQSASGLTDI